MYGWYVIVCSLTLLARIVVSFQFSQVSESVGLGAASGDIAALADFNSDRLTDILALSEIGKEHSLYLWNREAKVFEHQLITLDVPAPVVRVAVADFDGDGVVDIVSFSGSQSDCCQVIVHWCRLTNNGSYITTGNVTRLSDSAVGYPLILDYNSDHISDIGGTNIHGDYIVCISSQHQSFESRVVYSGSGSTVRSSAFVDIDSDCVPDLVLLVESATTELVVVNGGSNSVLSLSSLLPNMSVLGVPVLVDIDGDAVMEIVLLSCYDEECLKTAFNTITLMKYPGFSALGCKKHPSWQLQSHAVSTVNLSPLKVVGVKDLRPSVGDLNLDGYPDILITVANNNTVSSSLLLLGGSGVLQTKELSLNPNTTATIFFDLFEDGVPDLLVQNKDVGRKTRVTVYKQTLDQDNAFLKVLVLSGPCFTSFCNEQHPTAVPGATISFSTTDRQGHKETGVSVTGGYGDSPLQLPFILFGLGETPNFIESLSIGLAHHYVIGNMSTLTLGFRQWTLMVPNSQIVVLTFPANITQRWVGELYLSPSNLVYSTAGVLAATAVAMAVIIALLQAREKYLDSKEKQQAKHRFHFNAM